jgi:hypothetical protein
MKKSWSAGEAAAGAGDRESCRRAQARSAVGARAVARRRHGCEDPIEREHTKEGRGRAAPVKAGVGRSSSGGGIAARSKPSARCNERERNMNRS